jgi:hypothetical protein
MRKACLCALCLFFFFFSLPSLGKKEEIRLTAEEIKIYKSYTSANAGCSHSHKTNIVCIKELPGFDYPIVLLPSDKLNNKL